MIIYWNKFKDNLSKCNKYQIFLILIFIFVSCYSVFTASSHDAYIAYFSGTTNPAMKHLMLMMVGIGIMSGYVFLGGKGKVTLSWTNIILLSATPILLVLVALFGKTVNGATRWLPIGGLFDLQVSEVIKLSMIFYVSSIVCKLLSFKQLTRTWGVGLLGILLFGVPFTVIFFIALQHTSTAIIMSVSLLAFYWLVGMPWRMFFKVFSIVATFGILLLTAVIILPPEATSSFGRLGTVRSRVLNMCEDKDEFILNDKDRQEQYSKIALANGFPIARGPGNSKIKDVLPMANTDYIYAILVEEFGIFALLGVPALYIAWLLIAYSLSKREEDLFRKYLLYGLGLMYPLQAFVHFCVVTGFISTGQPLPFISYGGSSLLTSCLAMGIMLLIGLEQNIQAEQKKAEALLARQANETEYD